MPQHDLSTTATRATTPAATTSGLIAVAIGLPGCATDARSATPPAPEASAAPTVEDDASEPRDGQCHAKGWYGCGPSSIDVAVTLRDGDVTAVQVDPNATDPTSLDYQRRFASGVDQLVVGRPLRELGDVVVSGSSSTPAGYDDAVRKIREQASPTDA